MLNLTIAIEEENVGSLTVVLEEIISQIEEGNTSGVGWDLTNTHEDKDSGDFSGATPGDR